MKKLISLEDHNKKFPQPLSGEPTLNGIGCPICGLELLDYGVSIKTSYPAQKDVKCSNLNCGYHGTRNT